MSRLFARVPFHREIGSIGDGGRVIALCTTRYWAEMRYDELKLWKIDLLCPWCHTNSRGWNGEWNYRMSQFIPLRLLNIAKSQVQILVHKCKCSTNITIATRIHYELCLNQRTQCKLLYEVEFIRHLIFSVRTISIQPSKKHASASYSRLHSLFPSDYTSHRNTIIAMRWMTTRRQRWQSLNIKHILWIIPVEKSCQ